MNPDSKRVSMLSINLQFPRGFDALLSDGKIIVTTESNENFNHNESIEHLIQLQNVPLCDLL